MGEKEKTNFSLTGIEDDLIKAAVQETIGREHTEEELELLGLEVAENSPEFAILEQRQKQGLWNYPLDGSEVFSPLDENGDEIIPTDIEILRFCLSPLELCQYILAKGVRKHGSKALF